MRSLSVISLQCVIFKKPNSWELCGIVLSGSGVRWWWGEGGNGKILAKGTNLQLQHESVLRNLIYSMATTGNNTTLYT